MSRKTEDNAISTLEQDILDFKIVKEKIEELQKREAFLKENIIKQMQKEDKFEKSITFVNGKLNCKRVESSRISFDADKVIKKLGKEIAEDFVKSDYEIIDYYGLVKFLKKHSVPPKEFKKYINVSRTIDKAKLEQAYAIGELDKEDIKGCYTVTKCRDSLRLTLQKEK